MSCWPSRNGTNPSELSGTSRKSRYSRPERRERDSRLADKAPHAGRKGLDDGTDGSNRKRGCRYDGRPEPAEPFIAGRCRVALPNSSVGGLAGLVQAFQKNGLGDVVNSWVSTGKNLPISADQVKQVFGGDLLSQLAGKAGLSPEAASSQLSSLLPNLVDQLTPNGKIEAGGLDQLLKMFQGKPGA